VLASEAIREVEAPLFVGELKHSKARADFVLYPDVFCLEAVDKRDLVLALDGAGQMGSPVYWNCDVMPPISVMLVSLKWFGTKQFALKFDIS
jgi:hypothetical protein